MQYDVGVVKRRRIIAPSESYFSQVTGGGGAATTFDPANKNASFSLSGGDLIATAGTLSDWIAIRSVGNHSTGKYYCEFVRSTAGTSEVGLVNSSSAISTTGTLLGFDGNSIGWHSGGTVFGGGGGTIDAWTTNGILGMAYDATAHLVWFRLDAALWNNDGSANPATGTNGIASGLTGVAYAAAATTASNTVLTVNFGATAYAQTPPSGFGNW